MADRRPLIEGLKQYRADPALEEGFVYNKKSRQPAGNPAKEEAQVPPPPVEPRPVLKEQQQPIPLETSNRVPLGTSNRVPLTTRIRVEFATALKRASLERQLQGVEPNSLQDIVEAALEPWLRSNGYLK
jgi:hypothetical protein